jgi:glycine betaine/proline transport system substrate-binding protein
MKLQTGLALAFSMIVATGATAQDGPSCKTVRLAEPGWNDLAFTTGVGTYLLKTLGYDASSSLLGVDIIYRSMQNKQLDAFLGYWEPQMIENYAPYKADGSVQTIHTNLVGAKYTFAVPAYVYDAGVHDLKDVQKFADKFDHKMYGIEPGSNRSMFDAVKEPGLGLDGWDVVESSEQGMLAEVQRHGQDKSFILFQGWAPHPMNTTFDMRYLTGGDKFFGPNMGAATVYTQVRKGFAEQCPNIGAFLTKLTFDIDFENKGMKYLITDGMDGETAARTMLKADPARLNAWLDGVTTFDGKPALAAVKAELGL